MHYSLAKIKAVSKLKIKTYKDQRCRLNYDYKNKSVSLKYIEYFMKLKIGFGVIVLLLISAVNVFAQTLPCSGDDPDAGCPLDTWVIVLAIAMGCFAVVTLYRRKKSAL